MYIIYCNGVWHVSLQLCCLIMSTEGGFFIFYIRRKVKLQTLIMKCEWNKLLNPVNSVGKCTTVKSASKNHFQKLSLLCVKNQPTHHGCCQEQHDEAGGCPGPRFVWKHSCCNPTCSQTGMNTKLVSHLGTGYCHNAPKLNRMNWAVMHWWPTPMFQSNSQFFFSVQTD